MLSQFPALIVVLPLVVSFFVFLSGWWLKKAGYPLVLASLSGCLLMSIDILRVVLRDGVSHYRLGGWEPPWGIEYTTDPLNAFMLVLICTLSLLTAIYARRTVEAELPERNALFWCLFLLQITGVLGISLTADLFNLFVLLEVASLTGYSLVALGSDRAKIASFRYLIIGTIGASFYLIGIGYLYIKTGTLNMEDLRRLLPPLYASSVIHTAFIFIFFGFGIKIALFPLHAWQPDAYTYAPSAVTILLSTIAAKTAVYALIRVVFSVFTIQYIKQVFLFFDILGWLAAVAMVAGSVFAIFQDNLKRMLAYSSIANVGYIVLAIGLAPFAQSGLSPAIMHMANHAVIKGCMFMAACAFIYRFDLWDVSRFQGLGRKMPWTSFAFLLAILAMIGMPPSAGFITKWYLIRAALDAEKYPFIAVIFISTLLMIVYFFRVVETVYIRPSPAGENPTGRHRHEVPSDMLIPCLILGLSTFLLGLAWMAGIGAPLLNAINFNFGLGTGAP